MLLLVILSLIFARSITTYTMQGGVYSLVFQGIVLIILIPYMYYVYKWMVNVDHKVYNVSWETNFWNSCGKILLEMLLIMITVGIYMPLAMIRLYKYFTDRTIATSDERKLKSGYEIENPNDFLFIWGQLLLTIITVGIYYPWAYCKIGARILRKTHVEVS